MTPDESISPDQERLDRVVTQWSLLRLAHSPPSLETTQARQRLLMRYRGAIRSYIGALLEHDEDADEVAQDVLMRLLRGDFASADPTKGRFRDFLKVAVKNMVRNYWSTKQRRRGVNLDVATLAEAEAVEADETTWEAGWQLTTLAAAMLALEQFERATPGCMYYKVLKVRTEMPDADSPALAQRLAELTKKPWKPEAFRQQLRRARLRLAQLIVEEVAGSLRSATPDDIENELIELGLIEYVRPFLPPDWRERGELRELES